MRWGLRAPALDDQRCVPCPHRSQPLVRVGPFDVVSPPTGHGREYGHPARSLARFATSSSFLAEVAARHDIRDAAAFGLRVHRRPRPGATLEAGSRGLTFRGSAAAPRPRSRRRPVLTAVVRTSAERLQVHKAGVQCAAAPASPSIEVADARRGRMLWSARRAIRRSVPTYEQRTRSHGLVLGSPCPVGTMSTAVTSRRATCPITAASSPVELPSGPR